MNKVIIFFILFPVIIESCSRTRYINKGYDYVCDQHKDFICDLYDITYDNCIYLSNTTNIIANDCNNYSLNVINNTIIAYNNIYNECDKINGNIDINLYCEDKYHEDDNSITG